MQEIFVVTHPESTHHVQGLVGGWYDSSLTELGQLDAQLIARELASRVDGTAALFSSDLTRTLQTAKPISARLDLAVQPVPGLREKSYGIAGGKPDRWLREHFIAPPRDGERLKHNEGIPGAETKWDWVQRVYASMDSILQDPARHKIIVTHGGTAQVVIAYWLGIPAKSLTHAAFHLESGSISHLIQDDYFHNRSIRTLNSVKHLATS